MLNNDFSSPIPNSKYKDTHQQISKYEAISTLKKNPDNHRHNTQSQTNQRYLQNFILGAQVGLGTFSKVCVARHSLTNEKVAIKIIQKNKILDQADQNRLNREIKIMRKVRHPNIIQLYEIIETKKYIYLITEYAVRGQLFEHIISHEKLTELEASRFLLQLADSIQYLHKLGVAHRDLKPENLLLDHKFNIKVVDFGLSNIYMKNCQLKTACGSPCYACPQMINSRPYNGIEADIWSLGIVLYAMCFGFLPFEHENTKILYEMIRQGNFQVPEHASKNLVDLLHRILNVNPEQRATIQQIRMHPFCKLTISPLKSHVNGIIPSLSEIPYESNIQKQMKQQFGLNTERLKEYIKSNKHNQLTCTYYLILQRVLRQQNKSWGSYYSQKVNQINRYAIIEKVKTNIDKKLIEKKQLKINMLQENLTRHKSNLSPVILSKACKTIDKYQNLHDQKNRNKSSRKRNLHRHEQFGKFAPENTLRINAKSSKKSPKKKTAKLTNPSNDKTKSSKKNRRNKSLPKGVKLQF